MVLAARGPLSGHVQSASELGPARMASRVAAGLNEEQAAAVLAPVGPVRVVAGPGSGKTKVLTNRVAHLVLDHRVPPWNMLCITFTNKAASEMKERLSKMMHEDKAKRLPVGTFHGICARILRKSIGSLPDAGRTHSYVIYDETDSAALIRQSIKKVPGMDPKSVKIKDIVNRIDAEKMRRLKREIEKSHQDMAVRQGGVVTTALARIKEGMDEDSPLGMDPKLHLVASFYEAGLRRCNAFDFSDLLIWAVRLLRSCPAVLQDYRKLWPHLLVDEFQDTDFAQYELVRLLGEESQSVFVVGDMDQSIYGWRGADFRNMQTLFEQDFPGGFVYQLRKNYRSTTTILHAAEALITRSEVSRAIGMHKPLKLAPTKPGGMRITFLDSETDKEEASAVVNHIQHLVTHQGHSWGDMAVLYRANMQSRLFQEELTKRGIPFVVVGGLSFYARREIKDIISYLKLIANPLDELALNRVLNVPTRGIGAKAIEKLQLWAASLKMTLAEALYEYQKELPDSLALATRTKSAVQRFTLLMHHLSEMSNTESLDVLIREILQRTEYEKHIFSSKAEDQDEKMERWSHIQDLRQAAREHEEKNGKGAAALAAFLEDVALVAAIDEEGVEGAAAKVGKAALADKPVVKLMTIHASKGLEFNCVFLVGMEEGLLPSVHCLHAPELLAEERRLCYVAITRARDRLFLSKSASRFHNGKVMFANPSRFWEELT